MKNNTIAGKSNHTVDKILAAARSAFADRGYSGARMEAIAGSAGVNKATIYYQIGDKDALYAAVIHQVLGHIAKQIAEAVAQAHSPQDKLSAYIQSIAAAVDANPELPSIMMREIASDGAHLPRVAAEDIASVLTILIGIIEEGGRKGCFANIPVFLVHSMIMGTILFYKKVAPIKDRQLWLPKAIKDSDQKIVGNAGKEVARLVLKAIQKEPGGKA